MGIRKGYEWLVCGAPFSSAEALIDKSAVENAFLVTSTFFKKSTACVTAARMGRASASAFSITKS